MDRAAPSQPLTNTPATPLTEPQTFTIAEAAAFTGLHKNTIRMRVKMGQLAAERTEGKFGQEYRISREALIAAGLLDPPAAPQPPTTSPPLHPLPAAERGAEIPSQAVLTDLLQRHEQAMFRLGYMEAELARHQALAENAELLQAVARDRELEVRELRRALEQAQERAREIDELRSLLREMERNTQQMREEVERHRTAASRRWWHIGRAKCHQPERH